MKYGLEVLLQNKKELSALKKKRVGLVCHPASVNDELKHSLDLLFPKIGLKVVFGPQHGARGDKQDNMIESDDYIDPVYKIPVISLYGTVRRPRPEHLAQIDVLLFDLQDLGCRIYTFVTTLLYLMEECAKYHKSMIVLDRPNPAGRVVEGLSLRPGYESFVGAAPIPMRHGLTVGELALYYKDHFKLDLDLKIIKMQGYQPNKGPGFGWPTQRAWVNPSPNAGSLGMARAYSGTVMIEGTELSEGRGTTRALEVVGDPDLDFKLIIEQMKKMAPRWLKGALIRECHFEPTFHKHHKKLCHGIQFHTDFPEYRPAQFKPYRIIALLLKVISQIYPKYRIFRNFPYEYENSKLAFDVICGGPELREWIENPNLKIKDLENKLTTDEKNWLKIRKKYLIY